jgi:hypothetical protein
MKLYRVMCEIEYEVLCLADSPEEARQAVENDYAKEELDVRSFSDLLMVYSPKVITSIDQVDKDWRGAIVYHSGNEDITTERAIEMTTKGDTLPHDERGRADELTRRRCPVPVADAAIAATKPEPE